MSTEENGYIGRWKDEPGASHPRRRPLAPDLAPVVFYHALVDVDLLESRLRFNEAIHPEQILRALLENGGSWQIKHWPPEGVTERNRFQLLALLKLQALVELDSKLLTPFPLFALPEVVGDLTSAAIRARTYAAFPGVQGTPAAGGAYRRCEFEASVLGTGVPTCAYRLFPDGAIPPGLEDEQALQAFVRGLVLADMQRRIDALR